MILHWLDFEVDVMIYYLASINGLLLLRKK